MDPDAHGIETSSPDSGRDVILAQHEAVSFDPLRNEINMTNCYKHLEQFFNQCESLHFNLLIAYWIMAGYLGPVDTVEKAYHKGHNILMDLMYDKQVLEPVASGKDGNMIKLSGSTGHCTHKGFCSMGNIEFLRNLSKFSKLGEVIFADGILKNKKGSLLVVDGKRASSQVFRSSKRLRYLAYFNPLPGTLLEFLLQNAKRLSVLVIRGDEILLDITIPRETVKALTVLEISSSSPKSRCWLYLKGNCYPRCLILRGIPEIYEVLHYKSVKKIGEVLDFSHSSFGDIGGFSDLSQVIYLNLSGLSTSRLPRTLFSRVRKVRWLILRGSSNLVELPSIKDLNDLEVLDVSHCTSLSKLKTHIIDAPQLQMIDLSYTLLDRVLYPKNSPKFTHLFLRNTKIKFSSCFAALAGLQVLDLSGSSDLQALKMYQHYDLLVLDLSGTQIQSIYHAFEMVRLRRLIVRGCSSLQILPAMRKLTSLEVLDISGCKQLIALPILSELTNLQILDLSRTEFKGLPSFANPLSLTKLKLGGLELDSLEPLASLTNLVELDLSNVKISSSQEFRLGFLQYLHDLQVLNLSGTNVVELPAMSNLVSLRDIMLTDCIHLNALPDLVALTDLETLDLSISDNLSILKSHQAEITSEMHMPSNLRRLVLSNRTGVQKLIPLAMPSKLELLDLRGTDVRKVPDSQARCTKLPGNIDMSGIHLGRMGNIVHGAVVCNGDASGPAEIQVVPSSYNRFLVSAGDNQFFHLQNNERTWDIFVTRFPVSNFPEDLEKGPIHVEGGEFIFSDWPKTFMNQELEGKSVEIHGFLEVPEIIQNSIQSANNVALVGNDVSSSLLEFCSEAVKLYWIESCPNIESVLEAKTKCPERLVLSHLLHLHSVFGTRFMRTKILDSLKHIHIDCCPRLVYDFPSGLLPNLETLHLRFCEEDMNRSQRLEHLPKLQKLTLFELPCLKGLGGGFPVLRIISIGQCPELKKLRKIIISARSSLQQLYLDSCPKLTHVLPSSDVPEDLRVLRIISCTGLMTLFDNKAPSSSSFPQLRRLESLTLCNLPKLQSIGNESLLELHLSELPEIFFAADLPSLRILSISHCHYVNNLDWIMRSARSSLEQLFLSWCPRLEHALPSTDVPEKLKTLRISSCSGLVSLFNVKAGASSSSLPKLHGLETLRLMDLPKLKGIGGELSSVPSVELDSSLPADILQQLSPAGSETEVAP